MCCSTATRQKHTHDAESRLQPSMAVSFTMLPPFFPRAGNYAQHCVRNHLLSFDTILAHEDSTDKDLRAAGEEHVFERNESFFP